MASTHTLSVGDVIVLDSLHSGKDLTMTVWDIAPPGSAGRAESAGPWAMAHIRVGGYGIGFDDRSGQTWRMATDEEKAAYAAKESAREGS